MLCDSLQCAVLENAEQLELAQSSLFLPGLSERDGLSMGTSVGWRGSHAPGSGEGALGMFLKLINCALLMGATYYM